MFLLLDDSNFYLNREETPHESFIQHLKADCPFERKGARPSFSFAF